MLWVIPSLVINLHRGPPHNTSRQLILITKVFLRRSRTARLSVVAAAAVDDSSVSSTIAVDRIKATTAANNNNNKSVSFNMVGNKSHSNNKMCKEDCLYLWYKKSDYKFFRYATQWVLPRPFRPPKLPTAQHPFSTIAYWNTPTNSVVTPFRNPTSTCTCPPSMIDATWIDGRKSHPVVSVWRNGQCGVLPEKRVQDDFNCSRHAYIHHLHIVQE